MAAIPTTSESSETIGRAYERNAPSSTTHDGSMSRTSGDMFSRKRIPLTATGAATGTATATATGNSYHSGDRNSYRYGDWNSYSYRDGSSYGYRDGSSHGYVD